VCKQYGCKKARERLGVRMRRRGAMRDNKDNRQHMPSCERVAFKQLNVKG